MRPGAIPGVVCWIVEVCYHAETRVQCGCGAGRTGSRGGVALVNVGESASGHRFQALDRMRLQSTSEHRFQSKKNRTAG